MKINVERKFAQWCYSLVLIIEQSIRLGRICEILTMLRSVSQGGTLKKMER